MISQNTAKTLTAVTTLTCLVALSACGSAPKREPYSGADLIGEFSSDQIVGDWNIIVLNPVSDENKGQISQTINSDGTWTSTVIPPPQQVDGLGPMQFQGTGTWQVNGETLFTKMEGLTETSGNRFGGMMQSVMSLFMSKMSGTANAYEISANRLILVNEENGQATLFERK